MISRKFGIDVLDEACSAQAPADPVDRAAYSGYDDTSLN